MQGRRNFVILIIFGCCRCGLCSRTCGALQAPIFGTQVPRHNRCPLHKFCGLNVYIYEVCEAAGISSFWSFSGAVDVGCVQGLVEHFKPQYLEPKSQGISGAHCINFMAWMFMFIKYARPQEFFFLFGTCMLAASVLTLMKSSSYLKYSYINIYFFLIYL
jgi:hypothetical protein